MNLKEWQALSAEEQRRYVREAPPGESGKLYTQFSVEEFEKLLDDLAEKYDISTTSAAQILMNKDIRSTEDASFKDIDIIIQEALGTTNETQREGCSLSRQLEKLTDEEYGGAGHYYELSEKLNQIGADQEGGIIKKLQNDELLHFFVLKGIVEHLDERYGCHR